MRLELEEVGEKKQQGGIHLYRRNADVDLRSVICVYAKLVAGEVVVREWMGLEMH